MSNQVPGQPPQAGAPRERPTEVTVSSVLLFVAAALLILSFIADLSQIGTMRDVYEEALAGTEAEGGEGLAVGFTVAYGAVFLVLGIVLALLAVFNNMGKNPSRITTWVVGGIGLCCTGVGLLLQGAGGGAGMDTGEGPDPAEIEAMLNDALPSWYQTFGWISGIASLLAVIGAMVLLMLPAANEFFRKPPPEDVFEPPPPGSPA